MRSQSIQIVRVKYLGIVPAKGGEVEIIRVESRLPGLVEERFELVAWAEPLARRPDDEDLVAAGRGAALPLRHLPVPALQQRECFTYHITIKGDSEEWTIFRIPEGLNGFKKKEKNDKSSVPDPDLLILDPDPIF